MSDVPTQDKLVEGLLKVLMFRSAKDSDILVDPIPPNAYDVEVTVHSTIDLPRSEAEFDKEVVVPLAAALALEPHKINVTRFRCFVNQGKLVFFLRIILDK